MFTPTLLSNIIIMLDIGAPLTPTRCTVFERSRSRTLTSRWHLCLDASTNWSNGTDTAFNTRILASVLRNEMPRTESTLRLHNNYDVVWCDRDDILEGASSSFTAPFPCVLELTQQWERLSHALPFEMTAGLLPRQTTINYSVVCKLCIACPVIQNT